MDNSDEFVSYKKVLVFGAQSTGKSTLTERLIKNVFIDQNPSKESNLYIFLFILFFY